jgi:hypothetical protein
MQHEALCERRQVHREISEISVFSEITEIAALRQAEAPQAFFFSVLSVPLW